MARIDFTPGQKRAIEARGHDILVAASAGSGKTRVLVERVIAKLKEKVELDSMLILTFTEAAAREMKERIQKALREAFNEEKSEDKKQFYRRQLAKVNLADISTIDAFCLKIVKSYYYVLDLDPDFRLLTDETERTLLRESVWEDVRERLYGENDPLFEQLTLNFSNDRSDEGLTELVMELFDFANVNPDPKAWLNKLADNYTLVEDDLDQSPFYLQEFQPFVVYELEQISAKLEQATQLLEAASNENDKLTKLSALYATEAEELLALSHQVKQGCGFDELYQRLNAVKFKRAPAVRNLEVEQLEIKEQAKLLRDEAKERFTKLCETYFNSDKTQVTQTFSAAQKLAKKASEVVALFAKAYQAEKKRRHVLEFSDLEHLTYQILQTVTEQTNVCQLLKEKYQEIMIDEYQDTNQLQEAILTTIATDNMFMVGDVKQSIYAFRLADPTLFLGKYRTFALPETTGERIILAENFRSAENITQTTNFIFSQIMDEQIGEMDYDKSAQLVYGLKDHPKLTLPTEVLLYTSEEDPLVKKKDAHPQMRWEHDPEQLAETFEVNSNLEGQIALVAKKIKALHDEGYEIYDRETNKMRPLNYGDIAILSETRSEHLLLSEELKRLKIPFYVQKSQNYFQTTELRIMLALLALIDNPYQDIELAAVLRSPIVGLKENELAYLRINDKTGAYYQAVLKFYQNEKNKPKEPFVQELYQKISRFMEQLTYFRDLTHQNELAELILAIYTKTGFLDYVGGMPGGEKRQANLHALYERAAQYEQSSFKGLFQFIRFIKKMQEKKDDLAEAVTKTTDDAVNVMTIHGSKGLEFPVVFLIDAAKNFNTRSLDRKYLLSEKNGLALTYLEPSKRIEYETLVKLRAREEAKKKSAAEKMRLLYVALTRAQEKLFIVAGYKTKAEALKGLERAKRSTKRLLDDELRANAKSFMDWILPALYRKKEITDALALPNACLTEPLVAAEAELTLSFSDYTDLVAPELEAKKLTLDEWLKLQVPSKTYPKLDRILEGTYPKQVATKTTAYQAVSEIKRLFDDPDLEQMERLSLNKEEAAFRKVGDFKTPKFMTTKVQVTPAEVGTAVHLLLQKMPLTKEPTMPSIKELLDELVRGQLISPEVAQKIELEKIVLFYQSDLGKQLLASPKAVEREVMFSMTLPAGQVFAELPADLTDPILVHGIMDGYVITQDDEVILFDYKTDKVLGKTGVQKIKERYQGQLNLYQLALEKILGKKVTHKYLYLLDNAQLVEI